MSTVIEGNFPDDENNDGLFEQVEVDATGQATVHPLHPTTPNLVGLFAALVEDAREAGERAVNGLTAEDIEAIESGPELDDEPSLRDLGFLAVQIMRSAMARVDVEDFEPIAKTITANETDCRDLMSLLKKVEISVSIPGLVT